MSKKVFFVFAACIAPLAVSCAEEQLDATRFNLAYLNAPFIEELEKRGIFHERRGEYIFHRVADREKIAEVKEYVREWHMPKHTFFIEACHEMALEELSKAEIDYRLVETDQGVGITWANEVRERAAGLMKHVRENCL